MVVTEKYLNSMGYRKVRLLEDGTWVGIATQIYTSGLCVGLDEFGYEFRYCYERYNDALNGLCSMNKKDDMPEGPWIKRKGEGGEKLGPGAKGEE